MNNHPRETVYAAGVLIALAGVYLACWYGKPALALPTALVAFGFFMLDGRRP